MNMVINIRMSASGCLINMNGSCSDAMIICYNDVSQIGARMNPIIRHINE